MAIADVFDAVSAKRCYRDAMTLERSFKIIEEGSGTAFEPLLVDVFMELKDEVIKVHEQCRYSNHFLFFTARELPHDLFVRQLLFAV